MLPYLKHGLHVFLMFTFIGLLEYSSFCQRPDCSESKTRHSATLAAYVLFTQLLVLLALPQMISNLIGLAFFNAFPEEVKIRKKLSDSTTKLNSFTDQTDGRIKELNNNHVNNHQLIATISNGVANGDSIKGNNGIHPGHPPEAILPTELPHLCFRVVTRGLYPALVQRNVNKNLLTCIESGLYNFSIEVVTDNYIPLSDDPSGHIRQLVVPSDYHSSTGAMFKARALQYALEPKISPVCEGDFIVHLDEETLVTKNVIYGIINFALEGQHAFGQGLITYTNQGIVNWITTLADFYRVSDDMGKMRFQLKVLHKPVFGWKGSFVVTKYEAEKDVSFDHGPDGSIAEDCYFSMEAYRKGYTFDFIDGEMWEKSPFTIFDLIRQRKRWVQGIWLVVHSSNIPFSKKYLLAMSHYAMLTLPMTTSSFILTTIFPLPTPIWITTLGTFCFGVTLYMYFFGVIKSFQNQRSGLMLIVYMLSQLIVLPINIVCENVATVWGLLGAKHDFYIVGKDNKIDAASSA